LVGGEKPPLIVLKNDMCHREEYHTICAQDGNKINKT
jgi:hypothetical protein